MDKASTTGGRQLIAFFANLGLKPGRGFSLGPYAVCAGDDPLISELEVGPANTAARELLRQFRTVWSKPFVPACLLSINSGKLPENELRDFRNTYAAASVVGGTVRALGGSQWVARHSDHFDFYHFAPGLGGTVVTLDGLSKGLQTDAAGFSGTSLPAIGEPSNFQVAADPVLLKILGTAWERAYLEGLEDARLVRLFRSLEVAFHAGRYPSDGLTTANDIGTRIGLWVSAFEVLLHPDQGHVDKRCVQEALAQLSWCQQELTEVIHPISYRGEEVMVTYPEKLYDDLYSSRNAFMHGEPIEEKHLRWERPSKDAPLIMAAPCLYGAAVRAHLAELAPPLDDYEEMLGLDLIGRSLLGSD